MARAQTIPIAMMVLFVAVAYAADEDVNNRKLLQNSRVGASTRSQAGTGQAIKQTVKTAQRGGGSTANTKAATTTGTVAATLIARPAGPSTTTANAAVRATTPARNTGRHLMQNNRGAARPSRPTASGNTASAGITQAVQAANRGGSALVATQQATRTGQKSAQAIARPAGLTSTVSGQVVTTRPAQNPRPATTPPRGM